MGTVVGITRGLRSGLEIDALEEVDDVLKPVVTPILRPKPIEAPKPGPTFPVIRPYPNEQDIIS